MTRRHEVPFRAIETLQAEVARLTDALNARNTLTCVYCGMAYPPGSPTHGAAVLTEHIKVCEKHPLRAAEVELKAVVEAAEGVVLNPIYAGGYTIERLRAALAAAKEKP